MIRKQLPFSCFYRYSPDRVYCGKLSFPIRAQFDTLIQTLFVRPIHPPSNYLPPPDEISDPKTLASHNYPNHFGQTFLNIGHFREPDEVFWLKFLSFFTSKSGAAFAMQLWPDEVGTPFHLPYYLVEPNTAVLDFAQHCELCATLSKAFTVDPFPN